MLRGAIARIRTRALPISAATSVAALCAYGALGESTQLDSAPARQGLSCQKKLERKQLMAKTDGEELDMDVVGGAVVRPSRCMASAPPIGSSCTPHSHHGHVSPVDFAVWGLDQPQSECLPHGDPRGMARLGHLGQGDRDGWLQRRHDALRAGALGRRKRWALYHP